MKLKEHHPAVILIFFLAVLLVTMVTRHPMTALLSFLFAFLLRIRLAGMRQAARSLLYLFPMLLLMVLFNSLFNDRGMTLLFSYGPLSMTLESAVYGLISGFVLSAVMLWFQCYNDLMDSGSFLALMGKRLPVISMMVSMIFRFIPETTAHGREINLSRRALLGDPNRRFHLADTVRMTTILMAWGMENAIETADAMRAKAFDAGRRRAYGRIRRSVPDIPLIISMAVLLVIIAAGSLAGGSAFLYYPYLTVPPRAWSGGALACWLLGGATLFAIPLLVDGIALLWNRIRKAGRRAAALDPYVAAMLPRPEAGGPNG